MSFRLALLALVSLLTLNFTAPALAADADDMSSEVDELNADSDAAAADNAEVKTRMAKDKARAEKALRAAQQKNQAVAAKRQASADQLKQNDEEVSALNAQQTQLKSEVERLSKEATLSDKAASDSRTQVEKLKADIETLKALRGEKAKSFIELTTQHDKIAVEIKKMEEEKFELENDLIKSKEQEKAATESLAKIKVEEAAKKVKLEAYIAGLRERYHQAQQRITTLEAEGTTMKMAGQKLESTSKVAETEVIAAEAQLSRGPSAGAPAVAEAKPTGAYVFKRSCKVFEQPTKGAGVLLVQKAGAQVSKNDEGKTWISFKLEDGRKGYAAKTCF